MPDQNSVIKLHNQDTRQHFGIRKIEPAVRDTPLEMSPV